MISDDLALALDLAGIADQITTDRFRALDLQVRSKPDLSPVTDADTAVETQLRAVLAERTADAVLGEELGGTAALDGRQWVIDPIDGTKNFVRGQPVWATLIALRVDGVGQVGVVSAPALGRRWWAARGSGAWTTDAPGAAARRLAVSHVAALDDAYLSYSSIAGWGAQRAAFLALTDAVWRTRAFGDFWSYCMVAEGVVDIAAEPEVSLWDLAALDVLVVEAGGAFSGLDGVAGPARGSAVATNGVLHPAVLSALSANAQG